MSGRTGWYYLHTNGNLIYKRDLEGTAADIRESDFAVALWPMDEGDRLTAWTVLVEGLAAGANKARVEELAAKWNCDDNDADVYGLHVGCLFVRNGDQWAAHRLDFENLQESPSGFGSTKLEAAAALAKALGYRPSKFWGHTFQDLLSSAISS